MHTKYDISQLKSDYQVQSLPSENILFSKLSAAMRQSPEWNTQVDKILCNVEHVVYLSYCLLQASSNAERLRMVGAFILFRSNTSVALRAKKFLLEECPDLFSDTFVVQSQDLRDMLDSWDRANESTLAIKMRAIASYCMAFSVLEHCGFTPHFAEIVYAEFRVHKETKKVTSFAYAILDVVEFVLSRARICWESGTLKPLFHSSSTYLDWYAKVDEVRLLSRMRGSPDDIEGLRDQDYYLLLEDCISKGEAMISFTKTAAERKTMGMIIAELKILRHNSAIEQSVSRPREEPLGILVPGDPGIGKSSVTHILGKHYATVRGINFTPECRFDRNPFDDFMSGFKSSMWFIVMDDVACLEPNKCPAGDKSLADVIQLINMAPYTSNQAELEKKGKVPVLAKLVVANTNVLNMNVFHYFSHPSAVQRRFKFVLTPYVKKEFCKRDGSGNLINMLDGEKASLWFENKKKVLGEDTEPIPDYWDFELMEWLPVPIGGPKKLATNHYPFGFDVNNKPKRIGMSMFLNYYTERIDSHIKNQARMLSNMAAMRAVKSCGVCGRSLQFCSDRMLHAFFDNIECKDCNKTDCIHKHQCRRCPCMGITARCGKCNQNCEHNMYYEFCAQCRHQTQSSNCEHGESDCLLDMFPEVALEQECVPCKCGKSDCLWSIIPEVETTLCITCNYCMSEEDVMEGSCTVCLVQEQINNMYQSQSQELSYTMWFALYVCAFLLQLKKMNISPALIQNQHLQLQQVLTRGNDLITTYQYCDDFIGSAYNQMAMTRVVLTRMGQRVAEALSSRPVMMVLGVAISLVAIGKSCLSMHDKFSVQSLPESPKAKDEKKDPWKIDNYVLTPIDVGRKTSNYQTWSRDDLQSYISNNIFIFDVKTLSSRRTRALAVCDRYYLINTHALQGQTNCTISVLKSINAAVGVNVYDLIVEEHQMTQISEDVTMVFLPQLPNRKDIRELFARRTYNGTSHGYYLYREDQGEIMQYNVKRIRGFNFRHADLNNGKMYRVYEGTSDILTTVGCCGSPLIAETHLGPAVLGIHSAGNMNRSVVTSPIYYEDIVSYFKGKMVVDVNNVILNAENCGYELQGLDEKSCFRYVEQGSLNIYGSLDGPRSSPKSMVKETMIAKFLVENENYVIKHGAPVLKGYVPIHLAIAPMIDGKFLIPHSTVKLCVKDYFDTVESKLNSDEYCILQKLDFDAVINGADGIRGIDKINMNTSAGFPWKKGKKHLFYQQDEKWHMKEELSALVLKSINIYKTGRRNNFVFTGSFKDEAKEFSKIVAGKTRVFTGQNVVHLMIGRQYYLSFIRLMQRNNLEFENAVGCNAHSDDWDRIAHYLIDFANNLFDGDYKNYDKSMMAMVIMEIFDGIIDFHRHHSSMDEEDFIVMRGVAYDIAYAYVDFFGDLVSFLRNNPSGHLLTVIINSICGSVYLRMGYVMSTGNSVQQYRYDVRAVTYGDDVIISVKDSIASKFNFETYRDAMAKYNIIFTPASKNDETYTFKPLSEIDFLKRSFIYSEELGRFMSPLNMMSIEKSMLVCVRSKSITEEEQIVATLSSAHREIWQHGRETFEQFTDLVNRVIDYHDLRSYITKTTFLSYDKLFEYYKGSTIGSVPIRTLDESYEIQSSWVSTHCKSDHPEFDSNCANKNSTSICENGSNYENHQGVPQSSFLGKIWLFIICATLLITLIVDDKEHRSIAQNNNYINKTKENIDNDLSKEMESLDLHNQIFTGVTGEGVTMVEENRDYNNKGTASPVSMELQNFLSRPFVVLSGTWTSSTDIYVDVDLLSNWLSNTAVSNKINNYGFMRGTLCMRIVVDSTPFNYGLLHVSLLAGAHSISLTSTNAVTYATYLTQRPGAYLNPSYDKSVDLKATLLHRGEWFSLDGSGSHTYKEPGVNLTINTLFPLQSATSASVPTVSYRVYAWMEDVELTGATYMVQSQDVTVHSIPTASKKTREQTVELKSYNLQPTKGLPTQSLLMQDYLNVNPYITQQFWYNSDAAGARLLSVEPCPGVTRGSATVEYSTPLSFLDRYFVNWRGSLVFTFKVVCSKYHSGSLRLTWDPLVVNSAEANVQLTKVVNISEETEFEFVVPHNNVNYAFDTDFGLVFPQSHLYDISTTLPTIITKNGMLTIKVMNVLSGPSASAIVGIMMFLKPGPDFEFMRLSDGTTNISSSYIIQSQDISYVETNTAQYMGETFKNIRDILERPQYYNALVSTSQSGTASSMAASEFRYPILPGPNLYGPWQAGTSSTFVPVVTPLSSVNTYVNTRNTMLGQMMRQFVGVAGSMVHTVNVYGAEWCSVSLGDNTDKYAPFLTPPGDYIPYTASPLQYASYRKRTITMSNYIRNKDNNIRGAQWIIPTVNPVGQIRLPHLSKYKYYRVDSLDQFDAVRYYLDNVTSTSPEIDIWVSSGDDFQFIQFSGVLPLGSLTFSAVSPYPNGLTRPET